MKRLITAAILPLSAFVLLLANTPARAQGTDDQQAVSAAQQQVPAAQRTSVAAQQGPLLLEPVHNAWVIAPDVKWTRIDGADRALVGAYGGYLVEQKLLLGAGGYWEVNGPHHQGMAYGGFVIGYSVPVSAWVSFGARGLVGGGGATVAQTYVVPIYAFPCDEHHQNCVPMTGPVYAHFDQGFFIAEPQVNVTFRLTPWMAIDVAGGYRLIGWANGFDDQLRGATGSFSIRFGG